MKPATVVLQIMQQTLLAASLKRVPASFSNLNWLCTQAINSALIISRKINTDIKTSGSAVAEKSARHLSRSAGLDLRLGLSPCLDIQIRTPTQNWTF